MMIAFDIWKGILVNRKAYIYWLYLFYSERTLEFNVSKKKACQ